MRFRPLDCLSWPVNPHPLSSQLAVAALAPATDSLRQRSICVCPHRLSCTGEILHRKEDQAKSPSEKMKAGDVIALPRRLHPSTAPSPRRGFGRWGAAYLGSPRLRRSDPRLYADAPQGLGRAGSLAPERSGGAKLQVFVSGATVARGAVCLLRAISERSCSATILSVGTRGIAKLTLRAMLRV